METPYISRQICQIPADCYNSLLLARTRSGGYLQVGIPGLSDNVMLIRTHQWRCWNRKLNRLLLSWQDFRPGQRSALDEPVGCTMLVHHSYSRTIIHRLFDHLVQGVRHRPDERKDEGTGILLSLGGNTESRR